MTEPRIVSDDELQAALLRMPRDQRMAWLADRTPSELLLYKRILSKDDIKKLNDFIDQRVDAEHARLARIELDAARRGEATEIWSMVQVLHENPGFINQRQADWVAMIHETAAHFDRFRGYTPR